MKAFEKLRLILVHPLVRWAGVSLLLAAFALSTWGKIDSEGVPYQLLNAFGSGAMIANCLSMRPRDLQVAAFNSIWFAIAAWKIISM